jgi:hypothetical protein
MTNQQLELGYDGLKLQVTVRRREGRAARAAWWFAHMRRIVESAMDWQAAPGTRPEQVWFPGAQRQVKV